MAADAAQATAEIQRLQGVIDSMKTEFNQQKADYDREKAAFLEATNDEFQKQKADRLAQWAKSYEIQMKKVKAEKDWINRFKVGAQAAQAASRQKKLEKWQASEDWVQRPPTPGKPLRFRFPDPPRMGNAEAVADLRKLRHGYPDSVGKEVDT